MYRPCRRVWSPMRACSMALVLLAANASVARSAQRTVLLEKLSATWCPHCMAAAQALDELVEDYGDRFIPLEIFSTSARGGLYQIPWGQARTFDFYKLTGYPTAWFDGVTSRLGDASAYSAYLSRVNSRLAVPTDVVVGVSATRTGNRTYDVTASVSLEPAGIAKTVRVSLVEALDYYGVYDDDSTVPRNTLKYVLEGGFDVALTPGQTQRITRSITFDDASWTQFEDVRLVAWAQAPASTGPAEVYNASQFSLADTMLGDFDRNGVVNGADLGTWKNAFAKNGSADANGNGVSDGGDFLIWQRTFGNSGPPHASAPIPEPAAHMLLLTCCIAAARVRKHRPEAMS
jgi:hypothetical protein